MERSVRHSGTWFGRERGPAAIFRRIGLDLDDGTPVHRRSMSEVDDLSPYERHLLSALEKTLDRLVRENLAEVDDDHRQPLLLELLTATASAETPNRMLKKAVRTLVDSDHVAEIYASDDELQDILKQEIGA